MNPLTEWGAQAPLAPPPDATPSIEGGRGSSVTKLRLVTKELSLTNYIIHETN